MKHYAMGVAAAAFLVLSASAGNYMLPFGYVPLEYIQGDGTAYILTDYTVNTASDVVSAEFEITSGNVATIWCTRGKTPETSTFTLFYLGSADGNFRFAYNTQITGKIPLVPEEGKIYAVTAEHRKIAFSSGESHQYTSGDAFTAPGPLMLFASYYNGVANNVLNHGDHRLYSFKVTRSGTVVRDFVPCRRASDGAAGLYDTVTGRFFGNVSTSGAFGEGPVKKLLAADPVPVAFYTGAPQTPAVTVRDCQTGGVVDPADYDIAYAGNVDVGTATVTVTGKAGSAYEGYTGTITFKIRTLYRVTAYSLETEGDGQSWNSPMSLTKAITKAEDGDAIYLKAGTFKTDATVAISKAITLKGGFLGTDDTTMADVPLTVLDTDRNTTFGNVLSVTASSPGTETRLVNLGLKYGYVRGLYKTGAADLLVEGCLIMTNGLANSGTGKGAYIASASGAVITFRDTEFRANRQEKEGSANGSPNPALYLSGCKEALVENCRFFGNSLLNVAPGTDQSSSGSLGNKFTKGSAIYTAVKTTVVGSRFSGNCVNIRGDSDSGGTIWFASGSSGSVVSNCLFYGNNDRSAWNQNGSTGGCIHMKLGSVSQTVKVVGSTFAYNLADGIYCAAGINVAVGTLTLEDCVFGGNMVGWSTSYKCNDLCVRESGIAHVRNTVFGQEKAMSHYCDARGKLNLGEGIIYADPMFVTRPGEITALIVKNSSYRHFNTSLSTYAAQEAIDAHLLSVTGYRTVNDATFVAADVHSPAIDAAKASAPVGSEPSPNASRRNAGFYGGTEEASMSVLGVPVIADENITAVFDEDTYVTVSVTMAGETQYNAVVKIETFATDPAADASAEAVETAYLYGAQPGAVATLEGSRFNFGGKLYVRVTAKVPGVAGAVVYVKEFDVGGALPGYCGHGGGANVVHVRGGAMEDCDGSDWTDAFPTLEEALAVVAADATKSEIWIMGHAVSTGQVTTSFCPAAAKLFIRGGFTGVEDAADERPATGLSYVDGMNLYNACILGNTTGHDVEVERVAFYRMVLNGISKTGGGDLTVRDCHFLTNSTASTTSASWTGKGVSGRCIRVTSAAGADILVTNCVMRGNRQTSTSGTGGPGAALCFSECASATVVDCLMHRNGAEMLEDGAGSVSGSKNGNSGSQGSAIYTAVPTTILRCEISASGNNIRDSWTTSGGTLWFAPGSAGSVVSNCLLKCNQDRGCWNRAGTTGGAIVLNLGNKTDAVTVTGSTIAYNFADGTLASGGMTVIKGTANITNCVFGGNYVSPSATEPSNDIRIKADGVVNVAYTVFGCERDVSIRSAGVFNEGEGVVFKDPLFVTTQSAVSNLIRRQTSGYSYYYRANVPELEKVDCHLLSSAGYATNGIGGGAWCVTDGVNSPAIDAGTGAYDLEPDFNGGRRNAGYYGNTPEASKTTRSLVTLGFTDLSVTYPDTYSRPQINFTVTGDEGCLVTVHAVVTVGGRELVYDLPGCAAGSAVTILLPEYYGRGTPLSVTLSGTSTSGSVQNSAIEGAVEADLPPWYGRGGGEGVMHLWSGAPGRGDGSDWHNAFNSWAELVAAYNATNGIKEIWVVDAASPTRGAATLTVTTNLVIRGGFSNTCDDIDARPEESVSTLDALKLFGNVVIANARYPVAVERMVFTRSTSYGFAKSGAGDIAFTNCTFVNNARGNGGNVYGAGLRVVGSASTTRAILSRCRVLDNGSTGSYNMGYGAGAYFENCLRVTMDDTLFASNGIPIRSPSSGNGSDVSRGTALYATSAPLTARNCRFVSNHGTSRDPNGNGGAVRICGAGGGTAFTNCVFAGNSDVRGWADRQGTYGGALLVECSSADAAVDIYNCTIAYNLTDGTYSPSGLLVYSGSVTARNSIFYGNIRNQQTKDNGIPADVYVGSGSSFVASYCLFTDSTVDSVSAAADATIDIDWESSLTGDPLFVTDADAVAANTASNSRNFLDNQAFLAGIDVHLLSSGGYFLNSGLEAAGSELTSPCLDKGDPASPYSLEPAFNGGRVNLGAYGNTPYASRTTFGQPRVGALEVSYENGYSRPWISLVLDLESGDPCNSDVTIVCQTGGVTVASQTFVGVSIGEELMYAPPVYLIAGDGLDVIVEVSAPGAETVVDLNETVVTGIRPIWAGKGGGDRVIHVRAGADGLATGRDWTDAFPDFASAMAAVGPSYDEMWIAGDFVVTNALSQPSITYAFAIRGGFNGHENTPEERYGSTGRSTLDFSGKVNGVVVSSSMPLEVERVRFMRATSRGFTKTGSGQTTLRDCAFAGNTGSNNINGRGAHLSCNGDVNSGTVGLVTNCLFEGNYQHSGTIASGQALYAKNFRSLEIVDTVFLTNGAALVADTAPLTMRGTHFKANRSTSSNGGTVRILNSRLSHLSHCSWIGNDDAGGGALVLSLGHTENDITIDQCTIALNHSAAATVSAGITHIEGMLYLKNSVVAGNFASSACTVGCDLSIRSAATASIEYTLFTSNDVLSVTAATEGSASYGPGVIYGDPGLGTKTSYARSLLSGSGTSERYSSGALAEMAAFDGHLSSRGGRYDEVTGEWVRYTGRPSIAVDAGDPAYDWSLEPECAGVGTSGKRMNLGAYGNTPWATMTPHPGCVIRIR